MLRAIHTVGLCTLLLSSGAVSAQESRAIPERLTLTEAKRLALADNPGVSALLERVKAAEAVIGQARAALAPQVSATANLTRLADVSLSAGNDGDVSVYGAGASATWLLFDGFASRFRIQAAEAGAAGTLAQWEDGRRLLAQGVATAFLNCLLAQEAARITERDAEFNRSLQEEAEKRLKAGAGARVDVLNFSLRTRQAENTLLGNRRDQRASSQVLAALLGLKTGTLPPSTVLLGPGNDQTSPLPEADDAISMAFNRRADLLSIDHFVTGLEASVRAAQGQYMPQLVAQADYSLQRQDNARFNLSRDADSSVGIFLSWELFDGRRRQYEVAEARAQLRGANQDLSQRRNDIASEVRRALDRARTAGQQYANQQDITETTREIRDIVRKEYLSGLAALTRLNEVQTDLVRAEGALAQTRIIHVQAVEDLAATLGDNLAGANAP